jgi:WD40 repeat protein
VKAWPWRPHSHSENAVYAQPFNWEKLALSGEERRIADKVVYDPTNGKGNFAVSPNGVMAFYQNPLRLGDAANSPIQLVWAERTGKVLESPGPPADRRGMEVSPDGKRIAVQSRDEGGGDIIVIEPRGSTTRLTFDSSHHNCSPVWSPDGDRIAYGAQQNGKWRLYQTLSNASGTEELLYESELPLVTMSWSPDGKRIVFWLEDPKNKGDLWVLTPEDKKAGPLIDSASDETHALA